MTKTPCFAIAWVTLGAAVCFAADQPQGDAGEDVLFSGKLPRKEQALALARKASELVRFKSVEELARTNYMCTYLYESVVRLEVKLGDVRAAEEAALAIPKGLPVGISPLNNDLGPRGRALEFVARTELTSGDLDSAGRLASQIETQGRREHAQWDSTFVGLTKEVSNHSEFSIWPRQEILEAVVRGMVDRRRYADAMAVAHNLIRERATDDLRPGDLQNNFADAELMKAVRPICMAMVADGKEAEARRLAKSQFAMSPLDWTAGMAVIALEQAKMGKVDEARKWAEEFFRRDSFTALLTQIAAVQANAGDRQGADRTFVEAQARLRSVKGLWKPALLGQLVVSYAKAGDPAKALALAAKILKEGGAGGVGLPWNSGYIRTEGFYGDFGIIAGNIIGTATREGHLDKAKLAIADIPDDQREAAFKTIAEFHIEKGNRAAAIAALDDVWKSAARWPASDSGQRELLDIFEMMKGQKAIDELEATLDDASAIAHASGENEFYWAEQARAQFAIQQAESGKLDEALAKARRIKDPTDSVEALEKVAELQAKGGDTVGALKTVEKAADERSQDSIVAEVVEADVRRGAIEEAKGMFKRLSAKPDTRNWSHWARRRLLVDEIVRHFLELNDFETAKSTLTELGGNDPETVCRSLISIVKALIERDQTGEAAKLLRDAIDAGSMMGRSTKDNYELAVNLAALGSEIALIDGDAEPSANAGAGLSGWRSLSESYTRHGQMPKVRALYENAKDPAAKAAVLVASAEVLAQSQ